MQLTYLVLSHFFSSLDAQLQTIHSYTLTTHSRKYFSQVIKLIATEATTALLPGEFSVRFLLDAMQFLLFSVGCFSVALLLLLRIVIAVVIVHFIFPFKPFFSCCSSFCTRSFGWPLKMFWLFFQSAFDCVSFLSALWIPHLIFLCVFFLLLLQIVL